MRDILVYACVLLLFASCSADRKLKTVVDWQGHRGARGNFPENTWPAFQFAMDQNVNTLEMDVVISADSLVVVSHEPFMNHVICLDTINQQPIVEGKEKLYNIFEMSYIDLQKFDCGSKIHPSFLKQQHMVLAKPLLSTIIHKVKLYSETKGLRLPNLNIEIKYTAGQEGIFHPAIPTFSKLVYEVLKGHYPDDKWNIQSFDFDVLKYWHKHYPEVPLAALVEESVTWQAHIEELGFTPEIYSPYHILLDGTTIEKIQNAGMKVVPWTVNEPKVAERLIKQGVDGIITDYPKIAVEFKDNQ